jgi:hypothetical protein
MIEDIGLSPQPAPFKLASMGETALIDLRSQIDEHLTLDLKDINLAEELALQFKQAKALYTEISNDPDTAANQKAQVINSVSSILATITKAQAELYNAERLKKLEAATLKALRTLPLPQQEAFMELYGEYLG